MSASSCVSGSSAMTGAQWQVAVARKQLDATEQEGQNAVQLIQSAAAGPPPNQPTSVGQTLNIKV